MIRRRKVEVSQVDRLCDKCNGLYRPSGNPITIEGEPIQYPHRCEKCGDGQIFRNPYPNIVYTPIEDGTETDE